MAKKVSEVARESLAQAKSEGLDDEDSKWMAQGAVIREGRNQGKIGEELSKEMQAAVSQVVKQELKKK